MTLHRRTRRPTRCGAGKKALETEFLAIEQTAVAKLKKLDWKDVGVMHTYEFLYFRSHHPFVDGERLRLSTTGSSSTTRWWSPRGCTRSRSSTCRRTRRMMPAYLAFFFGACYEVWNTKERPGWLLIRDTEDEHGESPHGRSVAGFGEPPPPPKGLAGATPKGKKDKKPVKPEWDPLNRIVDMLPPRRATSTRTWTPSLTVRPTRLAKSARRLAFRAPRTRNQARAGSRPGACARSPTRTVPRPRGRATGGPATARRTSVQRTQTCSKRARQFRPHHYRRRITVTGSGTLRGAQDRPEGGTCARQRPTPLDHRRGRG